MKSAFQSVKVLLWDFDGTLYRLSPAIWEDIFEAQYQVIMQHTSWSHDKAVAEHKKLYKVVTQSSTDVVARLCNLTISEALFATEELYDRAKYVTVDHKLVELFEKLRGYRHMMFVNGKRSREEPVLAKMGLDPTLFETWFTPEQTGVVKPNPRHFQKVLEYTKLPADAHLVVGDRESVDLAPAKTLGMKTCLVYSDTPGAIADVTVSDVYAVKDVLC